MEACQAPSLPMDVAAIERCIPHRYPFLLIDRVIEYTVGERIVARKNISVSDAYLQGHFPGNPVMPGVLIVEGMAQASAVLGKLTEPSCSQVLLTEISSSRFRRRVVPGDVVEIEITVLKQRKPFFWFEGVATVDGEQAAKVSFSARLT